MAETRLLTDHDEIRTWAAARAGIPAMRSPPSYSKGRDPELLLLFDQAAYHDGDSGSDKAMTDAPELVEWDEWFDLFDKHQLALVVAEETPGYLDQFHELVRR